MSDSNFKKKQTHYAIIKISETKTMANFAVSNEFENLFFASLERVVQNKHLKPRTSKILLTAHFPMVASDLSVQFKHLRFLLKFLLNLLLQIFRNTHSECLSHEQFNTYFLLYGELEMPKPFIRRL